MVWTRNFLAKSGDVFTKNALNCRRNDERKRIKIFALMKLKRKWQDNKLAYKCPETLGNKGLSGILCFDENASATLLQRIV